MKAVEEDGFIRRRARGFRLLVARDFETRADAEGLSDANGFDVCLERSRHIPGGRGSNRILESSGEPIRIRPNRHGGILGDLLGDRFLSPDRPIRELLIWSELFRRGVPLPTPVLAISRRRGFFWRSAIASLDHCNSLDGAAWLATRPNSQQLRKACIAFARTVRRLHDAGGLHGDLHLRNLLIESENQDDTNAAVRVVLIDLDRARIVQSASARQRFRELMRFVRSLEKAGCTEVISSRLRAHGLSAYCAGDRELRRSMLLWSPVEARRISLHRAAWWLRRRLTNKEPTAQTRNL